MNAEKWISSILSNKPPAQAWLEIFNQVKDISIESKNAEEIRKAILV